VSKQVLVATLGVEPQVVTLTLDLLKAKGYPIAQVIMVHTVGKVVQPALERLAQEFALPGACDYRTIPVTDEEEPVADIINEKKATALLQTLYRVVLAEKRAGNLIHLCIAGGRKPMAIYGMVTAQLLFDEDDRLWYLLSEDWRPGNERVMHFSPGDRTWLVPVPVLHWSAVSPALTELARRENPWEAIQFQKMMRQREEWQRKREFIEYKLTPAEREVVRLACEGLDSAAIACRLNKSEKTVTNQFTSIYDKFREWRGFRDDVAIGRAGLVAEFAIYFALEGGEKEKK
jgi:CRISPR-associated protein Csx14